MVLSRARKIFSVKPGKSAAGRVMSSTMAGSPPSERTLRMRITLSSGATASARASAASARARRKTTVRTSG